MKTHKHLQYLKAAQSLAPIFSTCAKRQYFCFVLDPDGRVAGTGYNGGPPGYPHCNDGACPRVQEDSPPGSSYSNCIATHAEINGIIYSDASRRKNGTLVVNGPPCWDCGKGIANSGLSALVFLQDDSYEDWPRVEALIRSRGIRVLGYTQEQVDGLV